MKRIVEALVAAANLAYLVHDETLCKELRSSAARTLELLHKATDRVAEIKKGAAVLAVTLLLTGCGQQLTGTVYKAQVGRQVTEMFQDAATTWQAGVELRFDVRR